MKEGVSQSVGEIAQEPVKVKTDTIELGIKRFDLATKAQFFFSNNIVNPLLHLPSFTSNGLVLSSFGVYYSLQYLNSAFREGHKTFSIDHDDLKYSAQQCVYKGKKPLVAGEQALQKGDNFLFVHLPELAPSQKDEGDALSVWKQAVVASVADIAEKTKGRAYDVVALNVPATAPLENVNDAPRATRKALFQGKEAKLLHPNQEVLLLSREGFARLAYSPWSEITKAGNGLADPALEKLLSGFEHAQMPEEQRGFRNQLQIYIKKLLERDLLEDSGRVIVRTGDSDNSKTKMQFPVQTHVQVHSLDDGTFQYLLQRTGRYGRERDVVVTDVLGSESVDKILSLPISPSEKKKKLAFSLLRVLYETPVEELVKSKQDTDSVLAYLRERKDSVQAVRSSPVSQLRTTYATWGSLRRKLIPALTIAAVTAGFNAYQDDQQYRALHVPIPAQKLEESYHLTFAGSTPAHHLDWKLASYGIDPSGYYIYQTMRGVTVDNTWIPTTERTEKIQLPEALPNPSTPHIDEEKTMVIQELPTNRSFKLPLRNEMVLGALTITDDQEKPVPFSSYTLTDNTVEVVMGMHTPPLFHVKATLVNPDAVPHTGVSWVHATEPVAPLDTSKLNAKARDMVRKAGEGGLNLSPFAWVADQMSKTHTYSVNPGNKETVDSSKSPEEFVNNVMESQSCDCTICNAAAVLLDSLLETQDAASLVFGNLHGVSGNPASDANTSFLDASANHAFGMEKLGGVLDATPSVTVEQAPQSEKIGQRKAQNIQALIEWDQQEKQRLAQATPSLVAYSAKEQVSKEFEKNVRIIAGVLGVLGIAGSVTLARRYAKQLEQVAHTQAVEHIGQQMLLTQYSADELQTAYTFFMSISWGDPTTIFSESLGKGKQQILQKMRDNIHSESLHAYLDTPDLYDKELSFAERTKLRYLAKYLS